MYYDNICQQYDCKDIQFGSLTQGLQGYITYVMNNIYDYAIGHQSKIVIINGYFIQEMDLANQLVQSIYANLESNLINAISTLTQKYIQLLAVLTSVLLFFLILMQYVIIYYFVQKPIEKLYKEMKVIYGRFLPEQIIKKFINFKAKLVLSNFLNKCLSSH